MIELTEGMKNEDDASALLCVFRGQAFRAAGLPRCRARGSEGGAALKVARGADPAHGSRRASPELPRTGQEGMARKDLERILAEDSSYEGVREQLAELGLADEFRQRLP